MVVYFDHLWNLAQKILFFNYINLVVSPKVAKQPSRRHTHLSHESLPRSNEKCIEDCEKENLDIDDVRKMESNAKSFIFDNIDIQPSPTTKNNTEYEDICVDDINEKKMKKKYPDVVDLLNDF